jgi:serine protease Do
MRVSHSSYWRRWLPVALTALLAMAGSWMAVTVANAQRDREDAKTLPLAAQPAGQSSSARARADDLSQAFRDAAKAVLPAVVVIKAPNEMACPHCGRIHDSDDPGDSDEEMPASKDRDSAGHKESLAVLGSGFIVDASGLVVTNHHVVSSVQNIVVQLADGRQFPATREHMSAATDIAVLRIKATGPLPTAPLASSEHVEIGDWVLAIGCPLELEQTVSAGIISAKNRSCCASHRVRMLQTDAAINPGSSGGPLVNLDGQVVGITTSIASESGGYQGIGFAIPAKHAAGLLAQLTDGRRSK